MSPRIVKRCLVFPNDSYSWQQTLREKNNTFIVYGEKGLLKGFSKNSLALYMAVKKHCKTIL